MEADTSTTLLAEHPGQPEGAVSTADLAECTCPEFCERDHDNE